MTTEHHANGFAIWCDGAGRLLEVIQDAHAVVAGIPLGEPARQLCDPMSRRKFDRLVQEVKDKGVAYNWSVNIALGGQLHTYHIAGSIAEGKVLLLGATSPGLTGRLYEELMRINSDQANALRAALQDLARLEGTDEAAAPTSSSEFDLAQFTELNNELLNLQRELTKRNEQLAVLNEQKNQLLGMAAHDLRNPLGAISGFAKLLNAGVLGALNDKQLELTRKIQHSSEFMLKLVDELLDVSKIEAGKLELSIEAVDILELVRHTIDLHEHHAATKGIRLTIEQHPGLPDQVPLDAGKIEQVISNLVSNAIKYSPPDTGIRVALHAAERHLLIDVVDQGQGIPEAEQKELFKPFQKTSVKSTGGEKSTGLGLAIVQRIVQGHGGEISVTSRAGAGSTFRVCLPWDEHSPQGGG